MLLSADLTFMRVDLIQKSPALLHSTEAAGGAPQALSGPVGAPFTTLITALYSFRR